LPRELKDITCQPWIVQKMLDRKWSYERIKKILGINFLRAIRDIRP
jgi:microsomal dipeptidase-like Zn-dependent dipeptidase